MAQRTPAAWLDLLERRLHERWSRWSVFDAYYEGNQRLAFVTAKLREHYGSLFADLTNNYMALVVDSASERLRVQGFSFDVKGDADAEAWAIWQANGLDAQANMVHTEAIKLGEAYWLVQPNGEVPRITAEHPSQVIVATDPGDRRIRLAALKKWRDDDNFARANVYLPDRVVKYRSQNKARGGAKVNWGEGITVPNPLGVVPVIPVPNNPSMLRGGRSDLSGGPLVIEDAINKTLADMLIGSEYQALPQRVLLGVEAPRDPQTGEVISDVKAMGSRLWYFNNSEAKAHEFKAADLKNFREAIDGLIGDLAAQTRIPIYYFRPQAISNISAEALIGLDAGLVSKTNDKKDPFGESHEEAMRLAFRSIDPTDSRAKATDAETEWADTESRSHAQVVDAAVKKQTLGVPFEQIMLDVGYSPQTIDRMIAMRDADSLLADVFSPNGNQPNAGEPAVPATD